MNSHYLLIDVLQFFGCIIVVVLLLGFLVFLDSDMYRRIVGNRRHRKSCCCNPGPQSSSPVIIVNGCNEHKKLEGHAGSGCMDYMNNRKSIEQPKVEEKKKIERAGRPTLPINYNNKQIK